MTLLSRMGYSPTKEQEIEVPTKIVAPKISVIIPVKNNQDGISRLLDKFEEIFINKESPAEVIIVDNNSDIPLRIKEKWSYNVILKSCSRIGPAAARNEGASHATGEWLLFIDSDCIPSETTVHGYCATGNVHAAYAGNISVKSKDKLSRYYATQETLIPPKAIDGSKKRPDYLVTANCLVSKEAFVAVGGFDETFVLAGGEDIDLGFKLLRIGSLSYNWESIVYHTFDDGLLGFWKRFKRYGIGNRKLAEKYQLDLTPRPFIPNEVSISNLALAIVQYASMRLGYREKHITRISTRTAVPLRSTESG